MARPLSSILKDIHKMSDEAQPKDLFAMIYSEFGMGKTTTTMGLAQELRGDGKILFLDSSDGWVSLEEFPALMENTDRFRANDPAELIVIANALGTKQLDKYTVVVIDEISSIFDVMVEQYLREKYSLSDDEQIPEAEGRDYGPPTAALASLLRKFHQKEGVHFLITAHAREVQAEGGAKEIRASFPPKAYAEVMRRTHVTAALTARRKRNPETKQLDYVRSLQLKPSAAVAAKSRIRNSPVTATPEEFIELVTDWVQSDQFNKDMGMQSPQELVDDIPNEPEELPGDDTIEDIIDEITGDLEETPGDDQEPEEDEEQEGSLFIPLHEEIPTLEERKKTLKKATVKELRDYISSQWDLDTTGAKKDQLIEGILSLEYE